MYMYIYIYIYICIYIYIYIYISGDTVLNNSFITKLNISK